MDDMALVSWSLERAAERHGDPTPAVYQALFAAAPEAEALFVLDRQGAARGNMLANMFEVILDLAGPRAYGVNMIRAEVFNHENLGVASGLFVKFFPIIRDVIRTSVGEEWTPAVEAAWDEILVQLREAVETARIRPDRQSVD